MNGAWLCDIHLLGAQASADESGLAVTARGGAGGGTNGGNDPGGLSPGPIPGSPYQ